MSIKIIDGDLFTTNAKIICHQVNCQGEMNTGVAQQVREKFPHVFEGYKNFIKSEENFFKYNRIPTSLQDFLLGNVYFEPKTKP